MPLLRPDASITTPTRRAFVAPRSAASVFPISARAEQPFEQWVAAFRPRALARGVSGATYDRVMGGVKPDLTVYEQFRSQPEFNEQLWQYLNRRVSDWRVITGKERAKEYAAVLARIE